MWKKFMLFIYINTEIYTNVYTQIRTYWLNAKNSNLISYSLRIICNFAKYVYWFWEILF